MAVSDKQRIAAAQAYIDARSSATTAIPFRSRPDAPASSRGFKNGFSGNHLRRSLNRGPQYRVIGETTAPEYTITGDEVRAVYQVLTLLSFAGRRMAARRRSSS